jgi:polysaccharide export outer membrane protein
MIKASGYQHTLIFWGIIQGVVVLIAALTLPVLSQKNNANDKNAVAPVASQSQPAAGMPTANDSSYIIGPSDELNVSVWEQPELSRIVPVRPDGMISLPLINDVQAAGKTPMQLMKAVVDKLTVLGVKTPLVTVTVSTINSQRIYVMGNVTRAGAYPMLPGMTVLQGIASAGGLTLFAKQTKIEVRRTENGQVLWFSFNYKEVIRGKNTGQDIVLKPGDTILVP